MASLIPYTKKQLIQRIRRHMANDFPDAEFSVSENEVLLYIDQALAFTAVGQIWNGSKVLGTIEVPEGLLTTFELPTLTQNLVTNEWYATLPQPPVSLPLGYSITRAYFAEIGIGVSQEIVPISSKRAGYRNNMPRPSGAEYKINGDRIYITANDGTPLYDITVFVEMINTRTSSLIDSMALPDDMMEGVFQNVVQKIAQRYSFPKDIITDQVGAGNNTQKS